MTRSIGKKFLALFLALVLLCSLLPQAALPVSAAESDGGSCGDNLTWNYYYDEETETGWLSFDGWGDMTDFEPSGAPWYSYRSSINCVYLPWGLTSVGAYAFQDCTALTELYLYEDVTQVGTGALSGCSGLMYLYVYNPACALNCSLSGQPGTMEVAGYYGSTAQAYAVEYGYTFYSLGSFSYSGSCGMWGDNLTWSYELGYDTLVIEGSGEMADFEPGGAGWYPYRDQIRYVYLPEELTSIGAYAFQDCAVLGVDFWSSEQLTQIGAGAFSGCTELTDVWFSEQLTLIGADAFSDCIGLTSIQIPASVTQIGSGAFSGCTGLESFYVWDTYCPLDCGASGLPGTMTVYGYDGSTAEAYAAEYSYAFSSVGYQYYGFCGMEGENLWWHFDAASAALHIEGSGDMMCDYEGGWDPIREHIRAVHLWGEVTSVDCYAFWGCTALTSVELPESVTVVGDGAFSGCTALESLTIRNPYCELYCGEAGLPGTMTVYGYAGSTAEAYAAEFGYEFSPLNGPSHSGECGWELWWSFDPATGTLTVEGSGSMSGFESEGAPWYALRENITTVSLPAELPNIGSYAFQGCYALTEVVIPASVADVGPWAFSDCTTLSAVEIPDGVEFISDGAFYGCAALNTIVIPESVTRVGEYAFYDCSGLEHFEVQNPTCEISCGESGIPGTMTVYGYFGSTAEDYAEIYGYSFVSIGGQQYTGVCGAQGDNLTWTFDVSTGVLTIEGSGDMANYFRTGDTTNAPWSEFGEIITGLSLPENITYIGSWAIYDCRGLTYVSVPGSVTRLDDYALSSRSVRNIWVNEGVTSIDYRALTECTALYSIHLPASLLLIGGDAFNDCESLNDISVAAGNTQFSSSLGILYNKDKTQLIRCPRGIRSSNTVIVPEGVVTICEEAFMDCTHLVSVKIPSSLVEIGTSAFDGCTSLIGLSSDTGIYSLTSIGEKAFLCCSNLRYATIPEGVTTIGTEAFCCCTLLDHLTLPNSVVSIGARAFRGTALRTMTLPASVAYVYSGAIPELNTLTVLNPSCELRCGQSGTPGEMVVYGYADSTAQAYAEQFGYAFCPLDCFTDVNPSAYYAVPVAWAYENGITSGTGSSSFSPNKTCTRAEAVTFLWRAYGSPEPTGTDNPFGDVRPGNYYETAVLWAYHHEPQITGGTSSGKFGVGQSCTRAQVVTFLWAAAGKPEPSITDCVFTDVLETDYFYKAVLWAVDNGITSGTSSTTFSPNAGCTRGQIVTFLYRAIGQD